MVFSQELGKIINTMITLSKKNMYEYMTPEYLLYLITYNEKFEAAFINCGGDINKLRDDLDKYVKENTTIMKEEGIEPQLSYSLRQVLEKSDLRAKSAERSYIELTHILDAIMHLEESYAAYYVLSQGIEWVDLLNELCSEEEYDNIDEPQEKESDEDYSWMQYVTVLNDTVDNKSPLIGRKKELERTMQILCRKYKNNPLHIGEAGVGKTSIAYGLVRLINEGNVPENLKNSTVYSMDVGTLIAGTQFRGDFEKRFKKIMDGLSATEKPIVYIDEIHTIIGAGTVSGGALDASNLLKPYLAEGKIRFIGATTYEEFNKYFAKSKSLMRRFQTIDIKEPSIEESIEILNGLKSHYEKYHNVKYAKGTIEYAVNLSAKYINERFLPDKAIDLIDEAGAYRVMHPLNKKVQTVNKKLIEEVLSKICNIPKETVESDEIKKLANLDKQLKSKVFGQDTAIEDVVNAVKLSRAGLNDENKPIASFLFVGPTGVGKTEIAKSLASELNIELVRFDMSEYAEKHTVAKLIGSPAGYVGYEEGGLLTTAIRKTPHCVLLLDEIEKAHSDIYNILLQVMDYATLTDNQGKKADFRNVILIMTSNAGARNLGKSLIGFGERDINSSEMSEEVKKVFTPEFRNRLTKVVIFNRLNYKMAVKIVEKNINILKNTLAKKDIQLRTTKRCIEYLKEKGITKEYGAREIARLIDREIKPMLVDEILFGSLKKDGKCTIDYVDKKLIIKK